MRNAKDDLKACNAATPGPWQVEKYYHEEPYEQYIKSAAIVDEDSTITRNDWSNPLEADLDFIALAREALPYWIKRAQELERALDEACKTLAQNMSSCPWEAMGCCTDINCVNCNSDAALCWKKYFGGGMNNG